MRKTLRYTISDEGRDKGKVFVLTEMPASQAEKWAARALLAVARSGVTVPDGLENGGMEVLAILGIRALAVSNFADLEPLMDEMFECVRIQPEASNSDVVRNLVEDDIEEIRTRVKLREELITLHTGFSFADFRSRQTSKTTESADS